MLISFCEENTSKLCSAGVVVKKDQTDLFFCLGLTNFVVIVVAVKKDLCSRID